MSAETIRLCAPPPQRGRGPDSGAGPAAQAARAEAGQGAGLVPLLLPAKAAAPLCGLSEASWYRKVAAGLIGPEPVRLGRGCVRWRRDELVAWVAAGCPDRKTWKAIRAAGRN